MDAGSVLGLRTLRSSFLDDVSAAEARRAAAGCRTETGGRAGLVTNRDNRAASASGYVLDEDEEDEEDEEDRDLDDDDDDDDDEDDDDDDEEEETWQVSERIRFL